MRRLWVWLRTPTVLTGVLGRHPVLIFIAVGVIAVVIDLVLLPLVWPWWAERLYR